jgi:hypothetical protein
LKEQVGLHKQFEGLKKQLEAKEEEYGKYIRSKADKESPT